MNPNLLEAAKFQKVEASEDQILILNGVTWQQYEAFLDIIGDNFPGLHITYLEGTLQFMSPGRKHELTKKIIARLLEAYLDETRARHYPLGSTTFRKAAVARGIEPDECYCIGSDKEFPDLAIEVVVTSGGVDSLKVYQGLGVSEVWFWEDEQLLLYQLRGETYLPITTSNLLPNLDIKLLVSYIKSSESSDAVWEFREKNRQQISSRIDN
ncbi:Uma2 family endonuclease [Gloeocapsopsis crepidinum LEGE 06123]|uniref:Uma2 family endonuclease n=1 Tax=Gloeocapsopsis crepidinum LEGE 06123 TaxID=588587 RepID=A0ABR9UU24_9CHRO|nr:Uma2 family endonuclease [Gloeocapsopsis crepidinum]MBE9191802.1 Uma2 family endonuclease [Gloeocapsopsis crepidinum LEGE 06123]